MEIKSGKNGCNLGGLQAVMLVVIIIAKDIWTSYGQELVVTGGTEKGHGDFSRHNLGYAIDLRTHYFLNPGEILKVAALLKEKLGDEFKVFVEKTHIHVSFKPK